MRSHREEIKKRSDIIRVTISERSIGMWTDLLGIYGRKKKKKERRNLWSIAVQDNGRKRGGKWSDLTLNVLPLGCMWV